MDKFYKALFYLALFTLFFILPTFALLEGESGGTFGAWICYTLGMTTIYILKTGKVPESIEWMF